MDFQIICPLYTGHGWEYLLGALLPAGDKSLSQGFSWIRNAEEDNHGATSREAGCPKQHGPEKQVPLLSPGCTRPYQKLPPSMVICHLSEWAQASSQRMSVLG